VGQTVQELRRSLIRELDYVQEMANLISIGRNMEEFERIEVVKPIPDYCTGRVLTMEYLHGFKITDVSPVVRTELDVATLAEDLFRAYLKQILVDGLVHADPHPGNVFLTREGNIALIDLGMVAHVPPQMQTHLVRLILCIAEGRGEDAADIAIKIGRQTGPFDEQHFRYELAQIVAENLNLTLQEIEVGHMVMRITQFAGDCNIVLPSELTMVGKALLNLDQIGRILDPNFNPNEAVRRHAHELLQHEMRKNLSMGSVVSAMLDASEFVQRLPSRLNEILELVAKNKLQVQIDALDERLLIQGFQKVANRITVGLILAALIVGAAFLMRVETQFTILGYPGLAILLFLAACAGGGILMFSILLSDRK
jgi:predicted unusual protein kinase regulating ubiquinone biosynthesis (AarF/ABC1/UbiB family)